MTTGAAPNSPDDPRLAEWSDEDEDVSKLKRDIATLKWMVALLYPLVLAILVKLFVS